MRVSMFRLFSPSTTTRVILLPAGPLTLLLAAAGAVGEQPARKGPVHRQAPPARPAPKPAAPNVAYQSALRQEAERGTLLSQQQAALLAQQRTILLARHQQ